MAFLTINSVEVAVIDQAAIVEFEKFLGVTARSPDLTLTDSHQGEKLRLKVQTPPMSEDDASAIEGLVLGVGWSFTGLDGGHSALTNVGFESGSLYRAFHTAAVGTRGILVDSGRTITTVCRVGPCGTDDAHDFTVMCWAEDPVGPTKKHLAIVYDAGTLAFSHYIDGVAGTIDNPSIGTDGAVTFEGADYEGTAEDTSFEQIVILPYKANSFIRAAHYNSGSGRVWSDLPRLLVAGDFMTPEQEYECVAENVVSEHIMASVGGVWSDTHKFVAFDLVMV